MSKAFLDLEHNAKKMGLLVNENKTKHMTSYENYTKKLLFERVTQFPYLNCSST